MLRRTNINGHLLYLLYQFWSPPIPYQSYTYIVTLTEATELPSTNTIGLAVGLPLGVLLAFVFPTTTVAVVIAVCIQLSEKMPAAEYKVAIPPQLLPGPDPITTDTNLAYAIIHLNVAHASTNFNAT